MVSIYVWAAILKLGKIPELEWARIEKDVNELNRLKIFD